MFKKICLGIVAMAATFAFASNTNVVIRNIRNEMLPVPGSQKGMIAIINKQQSMPLKEIEDIARIISKETRMRCEVTSSDNANVKIEVIDDKNASSLIVYPEEYKAVINVDKMKVGLKGKALEKFFVNRCRKELLRAFCFASGSTSTQFRGNILTISKTPDLDLVEEFIPGDTIFAIQNRLVGIGITPIRYVHYARACQEGWAPAPTNDVQKAIWDKVHATPKNPMKIEFDPKKGR